RNIGRLVVFAQGAGRALVVVVVVVVVVVFVFVFVFVFVAAIIIAIIISIIIAVIAIIIAVIAIIFVTIAGIVIAFRFLEAFGLLLGRDAHTEAVVAFIALPVTLAGLLGRTLPAGFAQVEFGVDAVDIAQLGERRQLVQRGKAKVVKEGPGGAT